MIYDGYDFSPLLKVETPIQRGILADVTVETEDMGGKGAIHKRTTLGSLTLSVPVRIIAHGRDTDGHRMAFETVRRMIASKLYRDKPCRLVLDDAPDVYYMASLQGSTDLDRFVWTGGATLEFLSPKPYAFGDEHVKTSTGGTVTCNVVGGVETYPVVEIQTTGSAFTVYFDGQPFELGGNITSAYPVIIDATEDARSTTKGGSPIKVNVKHNYPEWKPGLHTVQCDHPFKVRWVEHWL